MVDGSTVINPPPEMPDYLHGSGALKYSTSASTTSSWPFRRFHTILRSRRSANI